MSSWPAFLFTLQGCGMPARGESPFAKKTSTVSPGTKRETQNPHSETHSIKPMFGCTETLRLQSLSDEKILNECGRFDSLTATIIGICLSPISFNESPKRRVFSA